MIIMRKCLFTIVSLVVGTTISTNSIAMEWDWDGSTLWGAKGVMVNGSLYDVEFVDGSCETLFTICDEEYSFTFNNSHDAIEAARALQEQVFVNRSAGAPSNFDSKPSFANGCSDMIVCHVWTPWQTYNDYGSMRVRIIRFSNNDIESIDQVQSGTLPIYSSTYDDRSAVYVVWRPSDQHPPAPPTGEEGAVDAVSISPASGTFTTKQVFDLNLIVRVPYLTPESGLILLDGADVTSIIANYGVANLSWVWRFLKEETEESIK